MRLVILSDVHGREARLNRVLDDAAQRGAEQIVALGDIGADTCQTVLRRAGALGCFGNYEVSGWRGLSPANRAWVRRLPPLVRSDGFLAAHAAPYWPTGLETIADFGRWMRQSRRSWRELFPYLSDDDQARWRTLAVLEEEGVPLFFHGHTHRQAVWHAAPGEPLRSHRARAFEVLPGGHRYLVAVGSVGIPEDGGAPGYALYESGTRYVELIRVP
jgi:diadenosine tetraphosphatase ApaH/serine/threonine PP2A family protein phosphatase